MVTFNQKVKKADPVEYMPFYKKWPFEKNKPRIELPGYRPGIIGHSQIIAV
jgi:hypothetical protein